MNQAPEGFSIGKYLFIVAMVVIGNIVLLLMLFKSFQTMWSVVFQFVGNLLLCFFVKGGEKIDDNPWAVGFMISSCLSAIPALLFLGVLGFCALTSGN